MEKFNNNANFTPQNATAQTALLIKSKYKYQLEIQQMMFVSGEVAEPLPETLLLVEDIVRSQVIEIVPVSPDSS